MKKLRECKYVSHTPLGPDGWLYHLEDIGKRVAEYLDAREHNNMSAELPAFDQFDKVKWSPHLN